MFCKKCDIELETECKAGIVLAILQTWFRDLVYQVLVIAFQVPILVCKQLGKTVTSLNVINICCKAVMQVYSGASTQISH